MLDVLFFKSEALQINMKCHALNILGSLEIYNSYKMEHLDLVVMLMHDE